MVDAGWAVVRESFPTFKGLPKPISREPTDEEWEPITNFMASEAGAKLQIFNGSKDLGVDVGNRMHSIALLCGGTP